MTSKTWAVFKKELLDTLRDGRSVFAIFVFPFVLYPAMLLFIGWMQSKDREGASQIPVQVGIVNVAAFPTLPDTLARYPSVTPVALDGVPEDWEKAGVHAVISIPADVHERLARGDSVRVELLYRDAENASSAAAMRIRPVLEHIRLLLSQSWARSHGAQQVDALPAYVVERKDISSEAETGRSVAALVIPYLLVFMMAAGSMHTAIDATTGEKERSTLETLLATSASRAELVMGKVGAVLAAALTGALTSILGLWLTFSVIMKIFPTTQESALQITIGPDKLLFIFLTMLPAAVFFSAVLVAIGCFARSMREGQTYATYVYMGAVFLGLMSFGQQTPPASRFYIPILNTALVQREILMESVQMAHVLTAVGVTAAAAVVMMVVAVRLFSNEEVLFRT
ncbi:MAG TPA: ABC transporter permease [Candidatus Eisenbacteria bacterium]|nr:ABC transporter permease [Candidatus Eisenbacteria bacterium]